MPYHAQAGEVIYIRMLSELGDGYVMAYRAGAQGKIPIECVDLVDTPASLSSSQLLE